MKQEQLSSHSTMLFGDLKLMHPSGGNMQSAARTTAASQQHRGDITIEWHFNSVGGSFTTEIGLDGEEVR